jgi:hypothetical protein
MKPQFPDSLATTNSGRLASLFSPVRLAALAVSLVVGLPFYAMSQTDNFDDGDDVGWTRYDRTGTATFSFPNQAYRIQASSIGSSEAEKALVFDYRSDNYTNFYAAVDLQVWDNDLNQAIGLLVRAQNTGPGTTSGWGVYWTPAISGGGNRLFGIIAIQNDIPQNIFFIAATFLTLDPTHSYRMVVTGVGDFLEARIFDLTDLTRPVGYVSAQDSFGLFPSGKCGLFAYSRNNTTVDVTFDNYIAAHADPGGVPAPGTPHPIPGTPQVVNRVPESNKNFHPPAGGISFTATTLGGNAIDPSAIRLFLNGSDVSSSLDISGSTNSRNVSYSGLTSNKLYQARITLTEAGGKSSTNEFHFDTFSESYITSSAVKMVEAEDYNYENGGYTNDPPPSGFDSSGNQVNGGGIGYLDRQGAPDVDYFDRRSSPENGYRAYRFFDWVGTYAGSLRYIYFDPSAGQSNVIANDTPLQKFTSLGLPDYQVQRTEGGEWLNYTRVFAPGRYNVYLRLSGISPQDVLFDEVTSDRTVAGQTTTNLGRFAVINTGHISFYRYFPLVDDLGNPVVLNWSGEKTFRLTMGGPQQDFTKNTLQMNYLMFIPASAVPSPFLLFNPNRNGNHFSVSFVSEPGFTYTLQHKNALTDDWTDGSSLGGDGTVKTLTDVSTESARFYRVAAR